MRALLLILFLLFITSNTYARVTVRYSVFMSEFKKLGGSEEGIQIIKDLGSRDNTTKSRNDYIKKLEKEIAGFNRV